MAERRRVAVTGIGAVTPIGSGRERLWEGLRAKRSAVRTLSRFDPSMWRSHNAAEVNDFDPGDYFERKKARRLDRFGSFSVACAQQAVEDAGIGIPGDVLERVREESTGGVGVGIAGMRERLTQLGGTLEILAAKPGTLVRARIRSL
ncbi:MAG: beta-ketoacyl synthase N-terminal-like domain-containing protein [Gemmatimonadaceae bacterium]